MSFKLIKSHLLHLKAIGRSKKSNGVEVANQMSEGTPNNDVSDDLAGEVRIGLSESEKEKHLLQYLLNCRGVCHENVLLKVMLLMENEQGDLEQGLSVFEWQAKLQERVARINLKLQPLKYQVKKAIYGSGRAIVSEKVRSQLELNSANSFGKVNFPNSSQYYVYIDTSPFGEMKHATTFTDKELEYIKAFIKVLADRGSVIHEVDDVNGADSKIVEQIDKIRQKAYGNKRRHDSDVETGPENAENNEPVQSSSVSRWTHYASYTADIAALTDATDLQPLETQELLDKLCRLRWLYKTGKGKYGLDLRLLVEMNDYLSDNYSMSSCERCKDIVAQGVQCSTRDCNSVWHVDCYEHDILHENRICKSCGESILDRGVYVT